MFSVFKIASPQRKTVSIFSFFGEINLKLDITNAKAVKQKPSNTNRIISYFQKRSHTINRVIHPGEDIGETLQKHVFFRQHKKNYMKKKLGCSSHAIFVTYFYL